MKTWFALTSYCRATIDTDEPGAQDAATISRFTASGHRLLVRRPPFVSITDFVGTSTSRAASNQAGDSRGCVKQTRRSSAEGYESARLPLSDPYLERRRLMLLCRGRYQNCPLRDEVMNFHRRMIDSGLVSAR